MHIIQKLDELDALVREELKLSGISLARRTALEVLRLDIAKAINALLQA